MKIVADENLAFTDYFFSDFAEIDHRAGRSLMHEDVKDADALLVRSVTRVNQQLIENTKLKFVTLNNNDDIEQHKDIKFLTLK